MRSIYVIVYLLVSLIIFPIVTSAQNTKIRGKVIDETNEPLIGVSIRSQDYSKYGITDNKGSFSMLVAVNDSLEISYIGYKKEHLIITSDMLEGHVLIQMTPNISLLKEVIVNAPEPISANFSTMKLDQMEVYLNPVAGGDALKAITLLPYSTTVDESASPSLRGSDANRSVVLVNGVPILNPIKYSEFNGTGSFSLFSTEVIKEETVYASNPPIIYGKASGGAIGIETIDDVKSNNVQLSTHMAGTSAFINQKISDTFSTQVFGNTQYSGLYKSINSNVPLINYFKTTDLGTNIIINHDAHRIKTYIYGIDESYSAIDNSYNYEGETNFNSKRLFLINNYRKLFKKGVLLVDNMIDVNLQKFNFGIIDYQNKYAQYYGSVSYKYVFSKTFSITSGGNFDYTENSLAGTVPLKYYSISKQASKYDIDTIVSLKNIELFAYAKWDLNKKWSISGGIRQDLSRKDKTSYVSAQTLVKYNIDANQHLLLGGGRYYSYSLFDPFTAKYHLLKSDQLTLDYALSKNNHGFSAALYLKRENGSENILNDLYSSQQIKNKIFGVEIFYEGYFKRYFKVSLGYTYLYNKFEWNNIKYKKSNHIPYFFKAAINYNNYKLLNAALVFIARSGTYYTPIDGRSFDEQEDVFIPVRGAYNSRRYSAYNNLSLNINKIIFIKNYTITPFISLNNIFDFKSQKQKVYEKDYIQSKYYYHSPFSLYFGVMVKFSY